MIGHHLFFSNIYNVPSEIFWNNSYEPEVFNYYISFGFVFKYDIKHVKGNKVIIKSTNQKLINDSVFRETKLIFL